MVFRNTSARNVNYGIELKSATATQVEDNQVEGNGPSGIYLSSDASGNLVKKNTLKDNWGYGLKANGVDVLQNTWTENLVFDNMLGGIVTTSSANNGLEPPVVLQQGLVVTGTTLPGAVVEILSDVDRQGQYFEGRTVANAAGVFSFTAASAAWQAPHLNATGWIALRKLSGSDGSTSVTLIPKRGNVYLNWLIVPPYIVDDETMWSPASQIAKMPVVCAA